MRFAIRLYTELISTSVFYVLILTFLSAYSNPDKTVLIGINNFGEAFFELCILVPAIPLMFLRFKDFIVEEKRKRMSDIATKPDQEGTN